MSAETPDPFTKLNPTQFNEDEGIYTNIHPASEHVYVTPAYIAAFRHANRNLNTVQSLPIRAVYDIILYHLERNDLIKGYQHNGTNADVVYLLKRDMARGRWNGRQYRVFLLAMAQFDFDMILDIARATALACRDINITYYFGVADGIIRTIRAVQSQIPLPDNIPPSFLELGDNSMRRIQVSENSSPETKYYGLWVWASVLHSLYMIEEKDLKDFGAEWSAAVHIIEYMLDIWEAMTDADIEHLIFQENLYPRNSLHIFEKTIQRLLLAYAARVSANSYHTWSFRAVEIIKELSRLFSQRHDHRTFEDDYFDRGCQLFLLSRPSNRLPTMIGFGTTPAGQEIYSETMRFALEIILPFRVHRRSSYVSRRNALVMLADSAVVLIHQRLRIRREVVPPSTEIDLLITDTLFAVLNLEGWEDREMRRALREDGRLRRKMNSASVCWYRYGCLPGMRGVIELYERIVEVYEEDLEDMLKEDEGEAKMAEEDRATLYEDEQREES